MLLGDVLFCMESRSDRRPRGRIMLSGCDFRIVEEETATPGGGAKVGQVESGAVGVGGGGEGGSAGGGGGRAASDSNPLQLGKSRVQHHVL